MVDTLGLIVAVVVTAAHVEDRQGLRALWNRYLAEGVTRVRKLWVEGGYRAAWLHAGVWSLKRTHTMALEVVEPTGQGFQGVPYRWVVERPCAWLLHYRRHRCDYAVMFSFRWPLADEWIDVTLTCANAAEGGDLGSMILGNRGNRHRVFVDVQADAECVRLGQG